MYIRIEKSSSTPISRQIAEQVRAQCVSGVLKPGECLPSVRQVARELAVNVNTVLRVYERLAADGWIEMRHGEGTFVLPPSKSVVAAGEKEQERKHLAREVESMVRRGLLLGIPARELQRMVATALVQTQKSLQSESPEKESHE